MIAFTLGVLAGFALAAIAAVIVLHWPEPEREAPPMRWSAVSAPRSDRPYADVSNAPVEWPATLRNAPPDTRLN